MRALQLLCPLVLLSACGPAFVDELPGALDAHNEARALVGAPPLRWDPELAATANAWAQGCLDVEPPAGLLDHSTAPLGENIYASTDPATARAAVEAWLSEERDYDYESNTCSAVCGHYTQVLWADSERVGCALVTCERLEFPSTVICNYDPPGNFVGERPY